MGVTAYGETRFHFEVKAVMELDRSSGYAVLCMYHSSWKHPHYNGRFYFLGISSPFFNIKSNTVWTRHPSMNIANMV